MKMSRTIAAGLVGITGLAASAAASAGTGSGTSEIEGSAPALTLTEQQPYQMTLERLPGTAVGATIDLKSEWSSKLAVDPSTTVEKGCIQVTGDSGAGVDISVTNIGTPTAPGGGTISFGGTPRIEVSTATDSCASAIGASGNTTDVGGTPVSATLSAGGELYMAWAYYQPVSGSTGTMIVDAFEEDIYSSSVDFQVDYQ